MTTSSTSAIKKFWNENPVGSNFINYEQSKSFYEKYDEFRYRTEGHILQELDTIDFKGKKVLEIGLGQGSDSMQIINRGALYYGLDLTEESVRRVKERFEFNKKPYQEVILGNAESIAYSKDFFDIVYSHGVIHHSENIEMIVKEIYRVLKPGGLAVVMLYHKNSFNYYISISIIRRLGLLLLLLFPFFNKLIAKVTGESTERIIKHLINLKNEGFSNFIHKSTDGPDNIYSSVWSINSASKLFINFIKVTFKIHFLNERHLLGIQYLLPKSFKNLIAMHYGWHLWIKATK
jgi:ubiquinone/menaquinone biosynthesis C-methylase UbiE